VRRGSRFPSTDRLRQDSNSVNHQEASVSGIDTKSCHSDFEVLRDGSDSVSFSTEIGFRVDLDLPPSIIFNHLKNISSVEISKYGNHCMDFFRIG